MEIKEKIGLQSEAVTLLEKLAGVAVIKRIPIVSRLTEIVTLLVAAVVAYVAPIFKRAKSIGEFHLSAKAFTDNSETVRGVKLETLNDIGEVLVEVNDRFDMPTMAFFGSGQKAPRKIKLRKNDKACYVHLRSGFSKKLDQIIIHSKLADQTPAEKAHVDLVMETRFPLDAHKKIARKRVKDPRVLAIVETLEEWPWGQSETAKAVLYHETGHRLFAYVSTKENTLNAIVNKAFRNGWGYVMSQYGMSNSDEFIAESFSCYMQGKHHLICPELLTFLKQHDQAVAA